MDMTPDQEQKTLTIIWLALMGGVAMYACVGLVLTTQVLVDSPLSGAVVPLVGLAMIVPLASSFLLRRILVERIPRGGDEAARRGGYRMAVIIGLAVAEGAGLVLVTAAMMGGAPLWIIAGGVGSILVMAMQRPDLGELPLGA